MESTLTLINCDAGDDAPFSLQLAIEDNGTISSQIDLGETTTGDVVLSRKSLIVLRHWIDVALMATEPDED